MECEMIAQKIYSQATELMELSLLPDDVSIECFGAITDMIWSANTMYGLLERFWATIEPSKVPYMPQEPPFIYRPEYPFIYYSGPVVFSV